MPHMIHKDGVTVRSTHGVITFAPGVATHVPDRRQLIKDCRAQGCLDASEEEISVAALGDMPAAPAQAEGA